MQAVGIIIRLWSGRTAALIFIFLEVLHPVRFSIELELMAVYGIAWSCDCLLRFELRFYAHL
jgi:hypothetical protein